MAIQRERNTKLRQFSRQGSGLVPSSTTIITRVEF